MSLREQRRLGGGEETSAQEDQGKRVSTINLPHSPNANEAGPSQVISRPPSSTHLATGRIYKNTNAFWSSIRIWKSTSVRTPRVLVGIHVGQAVWPEHEFAPNIGFSLCSGNTQIFRVFGGYSPRRTRCTVHSAPWLGKVLHNHGAVRAICLGMESGSWPRHL